jgi:hypothetical protein
MSNTKTIELEKVIVEATKRLDIEMFKEFSVHVENFKNNKKQYFVDDLEIAFKKFRQSGDTFLETEFGKYCICNKGCIRYLFIGDKSRNYITIIVKTQGQKVIDMGECCDLKDFKEVKNLAQRLYIHTFNDRNSDEFVPY